jgi:hypothetical protein
VLDLSPPRPVTRWLGDGLRAEGCVGSRWSPADGGDDVVGDVAELDVAVRRRAAQDVQGFVGGATVLSDDHLTLGR